MENNYTQSYDKTNSYSLTKVFGYMFLGLLLTAGVAFGLFYLLLNSTLSVEAYYGLTIVSSIGILAISILTHVFLLRNNAKGGLITYVIYSLMMGILLSSIFLVYNLQIIGYTFICTAGAFGAMALYGVITKRNTASIGMFGVGILFGVLLISLVNIFLRSEALYWIITYAGLFAIMAITIWDVNRAKNLADNNMLTKAGAIYFALQLYTDFIYIFLRLLAIIGKNRK